MCSKKKLQGVLAVREQNERENPASELIFHTAEIIKHFLQLRGMDSLKMQSSSDKQV